VQKDAGYKAVAAQWGTGGTYSMVASAVAGALGGLSANNLGAAAGGAMAPYIANAIKKATTTQNADGTENTNLAANTMAHAVAGAVLAQIAGSNAGAGAAGAAGGELAARAIVAAMYPDTDISKLTESQEQTVSTLSQIAAGLAGGIAADSSAGGGAGAGAGKNAVENNALGALVQGGKLAAQGCSKVAACRNALVEKGLGALLGIGAANTVLNNLSASEQEYVFNVAMTGKADLIEKLTPEQREAYDYMVGQDQKGLITIFPQPDRDLTGGKLVNPAQDENKGTTLTTPDQSGQQGATNTGNVEGNPDTGGNTTVTPIPDGPNKDNLAYLAEGGKNTPKTQASVDNKLTNYLLEKDHPVGGSKAEWFDKALGFNKDNSSELAKQIVFEPSKAVETAETQHGVKYDQVISITGANGRVIDVKFGWIKNNDGVVILVTAIPAKK